MPDPDMKTPPTPSDYRLSWPVAAALGAWALAGCAALPPVAAPVGSPPAQWAAPLPNEAAWPHEGRLSSLVDWWRQFGGPEMAAFVEAAQAASPSVSSATARLAQARAERAATGSALAPQFDLTASALRRSATPPFPAGEVVQGSAACAPSATPRSGA
jgi:outer membrane protein TolC